MAKTENEHGNGVIEAVYNKECHQAFKNCPQANWNCAET